MAFVVEDGTGLSDANAYVDVDYFRSYWSSRGQTFTAQDENVQAWIVLATDYIDSFNYKDCKLVETQALKFPQKNFGFPINIKSAVCEYGIRAKDGPLMPDPVASETGLRLTGSTKKVGPIEKTFQYGSSKVALRRAYPQADQYIRPYVISQGRTYR